MTVRVDYAGPGGACEGIRANGLTPVGFEWDAAACATRAAAGHLTVRCDLASYRPHHVPGSVEGYWASPPCQTFSSAGSGDGRAELGALVAAVDAENWDAADRFDLRTRHVIDAARVAVELAPRWVAMEQVPAVLPVFEALCRVLRRHGYSAWTGVLNSADYGVPQTRRRAILMASRVKVVVPPVATHAQHPSDGLFGSTLPWVPMGDALGWGTFEPSDLIVDRRQVSAGPGGSKVPVAMVPITRPSPTVTGLSGGQWVIRSGSTVCGGDLAERTGDDPAFTVTSRAGLWCLTRPATTVCADPRLGAPGHRDREGGEPQFGPDAIKLTPRDALILQSFDPAYPVQGTKTKQFEQIGNAVPVRLAAHIIAALTGNEAPHAHPLQEAQDQRSDILGAPTRMGGRSWPDT